MRFILSLAILATCAMCAPAPIDSGTSILISSIRNLLTNIHCSGRAATVSSVDEDAKVIYPDYRRAAAVTSSDEDAKVIYPDYRRATTDAGSDEDAKVIYPDYRRAASFDEDAKVIYPDY
ncbi:hypothetical protein GGR54DRAFT_618946 [Hypoxylon sp. NC1633]|nr:hypothetical protein GGR54DRAFT_618946 [Hypoxylon sp. NC1633]